MTTVTVNYNLIDEPRHGFVSHIRILRKGTVRSGCLWNGYGPAAAGCLQNECGLGGRCLGESRLAIECQLEPVVNIQLNKVDDR